MQKPTRTGISENQAKFHEGNSLLCYDIPKRTQQDLLNEKEYADYQQNVEFNQRGLPHHLLIGHGMDLQNYEKRDLGTTAKMSYDERAKADAITNQTNWMTGNTNVSKIQINQKADSIPAFMVPTNSKQTIKPRGYGDCTKKCDLNVNVIGFRK